MNHTKCFRILAVSLSTKGFGYAVSEGENTLVDYGNKVVKIDKNVHSLAQIDKLIARYQPDVLVLQDVMAKGSRRAQRIKSLHRQIIDLAEKHKLKVSLFSGTQLRSLLLGNAKATKHEIAELLVNQFPDELASRLPPKRRAWTSKDSRMDIFDAVALAVAHRLK
jgi:Holliday junction resolvasome RuvABC endonuclease subunit